MSMNADPSSTVAVQTGLLPAFRIERYFWNGYCIALDATLGLCALAVLLAALNSGTPPYGTVTVALIAAAGTRMIRTPSAYSAFRRHPYLLTLPALLSATSMLAPDMDANAIYFPALSGLALAPCVTTRRREIAAVILITAASTFIAALADTRFPSLAEPAELTSSTFAVLVVGTLMAALINWCATQAATVGAARQITQNERQLAARTSPARETNEPPDPTLQPEHSPSPARPQRLLPPPAILRAVRDHMRAIAPLDLNTDLRSLTARQLQVFYLVKADLGPDQAAKWLRISLSMVKQHQIEARKRTGLSDVEIVASLPEISEYPT
jgi:DNA-directed RNA polymerase specialized sigma24 family protein